MLGHVTVFWPLSTVHLFKDVGLFAAGLAKVDSTSSTILHGGRDQVAVPLQLRPWVRTLRLNIGHGWRAQWGMVRLLRRGKARSVTLYHATRENLLLALVLRVAGLKVYIKLDMNGITAANLTSTWRKAWRPSSWLVQALFGAPHLVSCEDIDVYQRLIEFPWASRRLQLIPNAMLEEAAPEATITPSTRQNIIVLAGRLGAEEKNYEMVLCALERLPDRGLADWQVHFCGPSTCAFSQLVDQLKERRPDLAPAIVMRGSLDRAELFDTYLHSKILLVTSRFEGFSLAALEAAWAGCLIASTPVGGMTQLTDGWRLGHRLKDDNGVDLSAFLTAVVRGEIQSVDDFEKRKSYVRREFSIEVHASRILRTLRAEESAK